MLVTALVGIDIWRYLIALTPLAVVLLARCSRAWRPRETVVFLSAVVVLTLVTQAPFQGMDLRRFFVEFFPYYPWLNKSPDGSTRDLLWPGWGWRFLIVTVSVWALTAYASTRERAAVETGERGGSHMRIGSFVIAVLLAATSALAHHSNSAFDGDKVMVLKGTVTEWKWTNPHVWIFLSVDDGNGGKVQWEIEGRTPGQLVRAGWSRTILKARRHDYRGFQPGEGRQPHRPPHARHAR